MGKNDLQISDAYLNALNEAKRVIIHSQEKFLRSANRISMEVRWGLGKIVDENSIKYDWGKAIIANFSEDLSTSFPDNTGFSERNILYMRQFYNEYKEHPELLTLAKEVSWGSNIAIMTKVRSIDARLYYLQMAAETLCGRHVIINQISAMAYEHGHLQDKKHN
jgi:predicted nuclease of restriction endonuclease-like (RecB) superfamily